MNTELLKTIPGLETNIFNTPKKKKILLIDNEGCIRWSFQFFAKAEGCDLVILETAEQGLELIKDQDFDIIIADNELPGISGLEFFIRIQESHPYPAKVLITEPGDYELVSKARKFGVQNFIELPDILLPFYPFN